MDARTQLLAHRMVRGLYGTYEHGLLLSATAADRGDAQLAALAARLMGERGYEAEARRAPGMAEGDRAAV